MSGFLGRARGGAWPYPATSREGTKELEDSASLLGHATTLTYLTCWKVLGLASFRVQHWPECQP
jgi:hypothetical protein